MDTQMWTFLCNCSFYLIISVAENGNFLHNLCEYPIFTDISVYLLNFPIISLIVIANCLQKIIHKISV